MLLSIHKVTGYFTGHEERKDGKGGEQYLSIWVHSIEDTPEGQVYRESVDSFNEKYNGKYFADIEFIPRNDSGGGYSDKVNSSVLSGGLPDVLTLDGPNVAAYAENGIIQPLADLTEDERGEYLEYDHPVNKFVAGFIGSPQMNFFDVTLKGNEVTFEDGNKLMLPEAILKKLNGKEGEMTLGIRGEDLKMDAQNLELYKENKMKAVITDTEVMGNENNLYFQFGGCQAVARVSKYEISQVGDEIEFVFMPSKIHFFDKETEMNYL